MGGGIWNMEEIKLRKLSKKCGDMEIIPWIRWKIKKIRSLSKTKLNRIIKKIIRIIKVRRGKIKGKIK